MEIIIVCIVPPQSIYESPPIIMHLQLSFQRALPSNSTVLLMLGLLVSKSPLLIGCGTHHKADLPVPVPAIGPGRNVALAQACTYRQMAMAAIGPQAGPQYIATNLAWPP